MILIKVLLTLFVCQKFCAGNVFGKYNELSMKREKLAAAIDNKLPKVQPQKDDVTNGKSTTQGHKIQTVTNDNYNKLTTKPNEIQTTESSVCPHGKSLFSKEDIKKIIDHIFDNLGLYDTLIQHIVPEAMAIQEKHMEDYNQFENWFKSQPEHLVHVLEGLAVVRKQQIEPEAQKIAEILKDYPQVKENIDEKEVKINNLTKKLHRFENLCKYNCDDQNPEPNHIFKRSILDDYLCSSIGDLEKNITAGLAEHFEGFVTKTKEKVLIIDEKLTEKIDNIKTDLKEKALKQFGRTMYDVLKLEDEYQHFAKEMNSTNAQILMYTVKEVGLLIDSKLLELQKLVKDYGNYCISCNQASERFVRQTNLPQNINNNSKVLHDLIQEKYNETEIKINNIIEDIFKEINDIINDSERQERYLNDLKLIQKQIEEIEKIERQGLEYLKSIASHAALKELSDLASRTKNHHKEVTEMITHLKKILN